MENNFSKKFISRLDGTLSPSVLKLIYEELEIFTADYEIQERKHDLIEYQPDTYPEALQIYLVTKKIEGKSDQTVYGYRLMLEDFFQHVHKPMDSIQQNDIRRYLYEAQKRRGIGNRSLDTRRRIINGFFQFCLDEGYISRNPMRQIKPIKFTATEREPLTDEELARVRDACDGDPRAMAMIEVLYSTGARVSELANLNRSDIDLNTREVVLLGKGNKIRTSYLSGRAVVELRRYWSERDDDDPHAFVSSRHPHKGLDRRAIEKIISQLGDKIGIRLFPHRIRHTSATDALAHGMRLEQVQQFLGHSKPETTEIYAKINRNSIKMAHQCALM